MRSWDTRQEQGKRRWDYEFRESQRECWVGEGSDVFERSRKTLESGPAGGDYEFGVRKTSVFAVLAGAELEDLT